MGKIVRVIMEKPKPAHIRARVFGEEVDAVAVQDELMEPADNEVALDEQPDGESLAELLGEHTAGLLHQAGFQDVEQVARATDEELLAVSGIGPATVAEIRGVIQP